MERIYLKGFFSKWGFDDGDVEFLEKYTYDNDKYNSIVSPRVLFDLIVQRNLLPAITNKIKFVHIGSCHNEHRIQEIDGLTVEWYNTDWDYDIKPEFIDISEEIIKKYCEEVFKEGKNE